MGRSFKKAGKIILIVVIVLAVGAAGTLGFFQIKKFTGIIDQKDREISQLKQTITAIGDIVTAYVVRSDVQVGKSIEESDLQAVDIPASMAGTLITNLKDIEGKYYKTDITQGTALAMDMVMEDRLDDSMRLYDVVTDENPIGLKEGQYVDIRISMPFGEDFVAMSHKRVHGINSGVLKLAVNELDIHTYNSMAVDKILYPGTRIYAVEYAEPGVQKAASDYYPISKNILAIVQKDPNLLAELRPDIVARRDQLETSLKSALNKDIAKVLEEGKSEITKQIADSNKELEKQKAEAEAEAKKAAKKQQQTTTEQSSTSEGVSK